MWVVCLLWVGCRLAVELLGSFGPPSMCPPILISNWRGSHYSEHVFPTVWDKNRKFWISPHNYMESLNLDSVLYQFTFYWLKPVSWPQPVNDVGVNASPTGCTEKTYGNMKRCMFDPITGRKEQLKTITYLFPFQLSLHHASTHSGCEWLYAIFGTNEREGDLGK